ncbi:uncharacterized protein LOC134688091 [Mytilus trossulus]|uniref:uncharacterized protein LOC134688091 n=1 Tax=Mytilus trossulus TaxID=6551 RepID=UPI003005269A
MKCKTSMMIMLLVILKVMHAAEHDNPCPSDLEHIVANMCTDDSATESSIDGYKVVDSVVLRITKQQNNCICHVSLQNDATNYTIYMSKYDGLSNSAPAQSNCGLAVNVNYVDTSDMTRSLQSIECTSGTSMRSIDLGGNELILKSRIILGNFTRGYCMQIYRDKAILSCKMDEPEQKTIGSDTDWIQALNLQSFDDCKRYCLQNEACVAVHYEHTYCFIYNQTTTTIEKDNAVYSQKHCVDTQKLQIKCYNPESTTTTGDYRSTTMETVTPQITDYRTTDHSSMKIEKKLTKDNGNVSLPVIIVAVVGWCFTALFALTTFYLYRRSSRPRPTIGRELNANNQYEELSASRLSSNYNSLTLSSVKN